MSVMDFTEYKCDVCGKTYKIKMDGHNTLPKDLKRISIPAKMYDCEGRRFSKGTTCIDMCTECFDRYWEYVQKKYDVSDCYGIEVKIKSQT